MLRVILLAALIAAVLVLVFAPTAVADCWSGVCCLPFGSTGSGPGQFQGPRGLRVVVQPDEFAETYFVVDSGNNRVQVLQYSWLGPMTFERQIGRWGTGPGELSDPTGVEIYGSTAYVVDTGNHRIQQFTLGGDCIGQLGHFGRGDGEFDSPQFAAVIDSFLYVTDAGNHRVQKFTLDGVYVGQWGSEGTGLGQFLSPSGVTWSYAPGLNNISVGDRERGLIQVFTPSGALVGSHPASGVEGFQEGIDTWDGTLWGIGVPSPGCDGVAFGPPFDFVLSGIYVTSFITFTDSVNDRLVLWVMGDPVEPSTWGSLKTRYRD